MKIHKLHFPVVGQRIMRSVIAVALCFVVYIARGRTGIPFYTALAVVQCIQPYQESSWKVAKKRIIGTFTGAFWGMLVIFIQIYALGGMIEGTMPGYLIIAFFTGVVIYSTVLFKVKESAYFSCVVFLSIVVMHMGDESPVLFVFNRILDTMIGIAIAMAVNNVHLPRKHNNNVLYVSGIDDTILDKQSRLEPYSKVELNRMIRNGLKFTVSTIQTPASVREAMDGVNFPLPIIAMDGAVLYDMEENAYLMKYQLSRFEAERITEFADRYNLRPFTNTVTDNLLVIYYRSLDNEAQQGIYKVRRRSPYRNYVHCEEAVLDNVAYLLFIDRTDKIETFYKELMKQSWVNDFRIEKALSVNYPGYTHIKVYHRSATREHMLRNLMALKDIEKSVTFGSIPGRYDVLITDSGKNHMVRQLKKMYAPVSFKPKAPQTH